MTLNPPGLSQIKLKNRVCCGTMVALTNAAKLDAGSADSVIGQRIACALRNDGKAHCVPRSFRRQAGASLRVAKVAVISQFFVRQTLSLMARRAARAGPSPSQRETCWVRPPAIFQLLLGHEEWTCHSSGTSESHKFLDPTL